MTFARAPQAIVVDASVAFDVAAGVGDWPLRWREWRSTRAQLLAPPHFRLEVANAFMKSTQRERAVLVALRLRLVFESGIEVIDRGLPGMIEAVELAEQHGLTVYDAAYLQLAVDMEAELATLDRALARAAVSEGLIVHD